MAPISDAFRMIIVVLCVTHCVVSLHDCVELLQVPTILNRLEDQNGNLEFLAKLDPLTLDVQGVEHPRMNSLVLLNLGLMEEDDLANITMHGLLGVERVVLRGLLPSLAISDLSRAM